MSYQIVLILSLLLAIGCTTSSADLNKIAKDSIKINQELRELAATLDGKYLGADKDTILVSLGTARKKSNNPYPYKLDINCKGKTCEQGYSDEIWFYEFKKEFSNGWETYSVYVYFKDGKVVRIR